MRVWAGGAALAKPKTSNGPFSFSNQGLRQKDVFVNTNVSSA